jgi:hypothetical protein
MVRGVKDLSGPGGYTAAGEAMFKPCWSNPFTSHSHRCQVEAEVAGWRAARPAALAAVSRQLAEGLLAEAVDAMIAEVCMRVCV